MFWENYIFDPPFPQEYIIGLGLVLAGLTVINYSRALGAIGWFRRSLFGIIRLAVIAALTIILLRPMQVEVEEVPTSKSVFQVLIDTSKSMNTDDSNEGTRLETIVNGLKNSSDSFDQLGRMFDVQYYRFDDRLKPSTRDELVALQTADGESTDIATSLLNVANAQSSHKRAGILLVSDGREKK